MSGENLLEAAIRAAVRALGHASGRNRDRALARSGGAQSATVAPALSEPLEARYFLSSAPAAFLPDATFAVGAHSYSAISADVNGDGKPDVIVANFRNNDVSVLLGNGDGTFKSQVTFGAGPYPRSVATADVNGDGRADLIVANFTNPGSVSVLLGNGNGTFQLQISYAVDSYAHTVSSVDVNGDGKPDLLATSFLNDDLSVLLGNGDGTFQAPLTFAAGSRPFSFATADVNGDGKPDVIVADDGHFSVNILLGNGDGTFQSPATFAAGSRPISVAVADVNGDGKPDLITANYQSNSIGLLLGLGDGTFQAQVTFGAGTKPYAVTAADVNGDGKPDILIANQGSHSVSVLLGGGDGTFSHQVTFVAGSSPSDLVTADINADGKADVIVANAANLSVSVLLADVPPVVQSIDRSSPAGPTASGSGVTFAVTFSKPVTGVDSTDFALATTGNVAAGSLAVSGSGVAYTVSVGGIVGAGSLGLNLLDDGTITDSLGVPLRTFSFLPQATFAVGSAPRSIASADVNGDGKADLISANADLANVSVLLGNGDGTFGDPATFSADNDPLSIVSADVNGDGKPDLITANGASSNDVAVLLGNGDGTFQAPVTFAAGTYPTSVASADVNGDGKLDLITANYSAGGVSVLLGNGDGTFHMQATFATDLGPFSVAAADVNGDGKPDLLVALASGGHAGVLLGNGNGTFKPEVTFSVGGIPESVAVADVNSDGKLDLITANSAGNTVSVLAGLGNGTFLAQQTFATGSAPYSVVAADVDGDGHADLVVANKSSNSIGVLLGNGNGTFKPQITFAGGAGLTSVALADVSRDGSPDLVTANAGSNDVSVLASNTAATFVGQAYTVEALHFDFGTPSSPVAAGYAGVSEATTYASAQGYGWQTAPAGSRDRATADPLTRDFVYAGSAGATFATDLSNGTYSVTIKLGDPTTKRDDQGIFFEGSSTAAANVTTNAGQVYTNTFNVTVSDGQLNMTLKDLGGNDAYATIDSLDIAPLVPNHFDFGPVTSPVAAGYTRASETTLFSTATGYGWQTAPAGSRDRGTSDPLTRDFVFAGSAGSTFTANVPNGIYSVTIKLGDATTKRDDQGIFFEGSSTAAADVTTNAGQVYTNTFAVAVSDGQLNVMLKDLGGADGFATIDSLDIAPYSAHYDLGTTTSPVASGYTRVSEATIFSTAAGYGWLAAPAGSRDRGAVAGTTALTQDFDYTSSSGSTFAVNLPNGSYNVTVTMGDATTKRDNQGIYLEGSLKDTVTTNANQYFIKTYAVTVVNNQLTLLLKDLGGNDPYSVIDGLDIVAA